MAELLRVIEPHEPLPENERAFVIEFECNRNVNFVKVPKLRVWPLEISPKIGVVTEWNGGWIVDSRWRYPELVPERYFPEGIISIGPTRLWVTPPGDIEHYY